MVPGNNPHLWYPRTKSQISDITATLQNLRPLFNYTANQKDNDKTAQVLNKASWGWWYKTYADLRIGEALQWSACNRTGYIFPKWDPNFYGRGMGDIRLGVGGPKSVLPLWLKEDNDIQGAYAAIIVETLPITEAWATYPVYQDSIKPDGDSSWAIVRGLRRIQDYALKGAKALYEGGSNNKQPGQVPTVTIYHAYIRDSSLNLTKREQPMGTPSSYWSYTVPYLGADIPTGLINPATGQDLTRKAEEEDTQLYPGRRLISFTENQILYDGPSRWFHGRAPIVKVTLDAWPWTYLGGSMIDDVRSVNDNNARDLQQISKSVKLRLNPPIQYDENQFEKSFMESKPLDQPGAAYAADFSTGDAIRPIAPPTQYEVPVWITQHLKDMEGRSDDLLGRADMAALARARQMPSGDTQQQFLQMVGARTQGKSRYMDFAMSELAEQVKGLMFQFYTAQRRFQLFGFEGVTKEDFDMDPNILVPATFAGIQEGSSAYQYRYQRARKYQHCFSVQIEPYSLHEITSMTRQLLQLRLYEGGRFPLDSWTLAKTLNISNFGRPPEGLDDDSVYKRWLAEQELKAKAGALLQAETQRILMQASPEQMMMAMLQKMQGGQGGDEGGAPAAPSDGGGNPEGRPSSFNDSPRLEQKNDGEGGQRTIINTSR